MPLTSATSAVPGLVPTGEGRTSVRGLAWDGLSALGVALLPKCPMCMMAYASFFGGLGVEGLPLGQAWPVAVGLMGISLGLTGYRAWRRARLPRFAVAVLGAAVLVLGRWLDAPRAVAVVGFVLLGAGLLWTRWGLRRRAALAAG